MLFLVLAQMLAPQDPAAVSQKFLDAMIAGKSAEAAALFTDAILASKPQAAIDDAWKKTTGPLGAWVKTGEAAKTPVGDNLVFVRKVEFAKGAITTSVTVNVKSLRVEGFHLKPVAGPFTSAAYVKADAFRTEDATFSAAKDFPLPGVFAIPTGKGPFPAVVLVHGSGPNDRDESLGACKPFRDLAEGLATKGIAVFRYDKRTFVHGVRVKDPTIDTEVIDDAVAAIAWVRARPEVDAKRVVVVGHSLGALLAPKIAQVAKANGAVLLAPPARKPWEILPQQYRYLGVPEAQVAQLEQQLAAVRDGKAQGVVLGAPAAYWRDWAAQDGIAVAKALTVPVLVMRGDRDYQVNETDWAGWKKGMAGVKHAQLVEVPGANHLFVVGTGKPSPAEYEQPGHVEPSVLAAIEKFVRTP